MKDSLFVYGTLMPNCPNSYVLENIVGKFVPATVKGKLIDAGWSASMGYPGIRLEIGLNAQLVDELVHLLQHQYYHVSK